ncbi:MAG: hydroxymethylbilane synthase [Clostridia bacterium]|nr:hydroxymethylbilane synthase [Clostridia bacterium]
MPNTIRIGTRKSPLAIRQTQIAVQHLKAAFPSDTFEIIGFSTKGDELLNRPLTQLGGKGLFTKELETALLNGEIDMAVHSAKDMPSILPSGLQIGAVLPRADARDVLVTVSGERLSELASGSVIGTGSLRREIQIKKINPSVKVKPIRGNINTRLKKLENREYQAIVLAMAGLERMGLADGAFGLDIFDIDTFLPAPGQGILAIEAREGDMLHYLGAVNCRSAEAALCAERSFSEHIGIGCNAPAGAYAEIEENTLSLNAFFAYGENIIRVYGEGKKDDAALIGKNLAEQVKKKLEYNI